MSRLTSTFLRINGKSYGLEPDCDFDRFVTLLPAQELVLENWVGAAESNLQGTGIVGGELGRWFGSFGFENIMASIASASANDQNLSLAKDNVIFNGMFCWNVNGPYRTSFTGKLGFIAPDTINDLGLKNELLETPTLRGHPVLSLCVKDEIVSELDLVALFKSFRIIGNQMNSFLGITHGILIHSQTSLVFSPGPCQFVLTLGAAIAYVELVPNKIKLIRPKLILRRNRRCFVGGRINDCRSCELVDGLIEVSVVEGSALNIEGTVRVDLDYGALNLQISDHVDDIIKLFYPNGDPFQAIKPDVIVLPDQGIKLSIPYFDNSGPSSLEARVRTCLYGVEVSLKAEVSGSTISGSALEEKTVTVDQIFADFRLPPCLKDRQVHDLVTRITPHCTKIQMVISGVQICNQVLPRVLISFSKYQYEEPQFGVDCDLQLADDRLVSLGSDTDKSWLLRGRYAMLSLTEFLEIFTLETQDLLRNMIPKGAIVENSRFVINLEAEVLEISAAINLNNQGFSFTYTNDALKQPPCCITLSANEIDLSQLLNLKSQDPDDHRQIRVSF